MSTSAAPISALPNGQKTKKRSRSVSDDDDDADKECHVWTPEEDEKVSLERNAGRSFRLTGKDLGLPAKVVRQRFTSLTRKHAVAVAKAAEAKPHMAAAAAASSSAAQPVTESKRARLESSAAAGAVAEAATTVAATTATEPRETTSKPTRLGLFTCARADPTYAHGRMRYSGCTLVTNVNMWKAGVWKGVWKKGENFDVITVNLVTEKIAFTHATGEYETSLCVDI